MTKVFFGEKKRFLLKKLIPPKSNILIVCSKRSRNIFLKQKKFGIKNSCIFTWIDNISANPETNKIKNLLKFLKKKNYNFILAIGGGSVLDVSKVIKFKLLKKKIRKIKLLCMPTTSGTGSEVTKFSTLWDFKNKKKESLEHKSMRPDYAIVDPVLCYTLTKDLTYSTSLDALNQCFDSLWSKKSNGRIRDLAISTIKILLNGIEKILKNINDKNARSLLSYGSLKSGECINKTKTSICHSISYPLTLNYKINHGFACAFTMLAVIKFVHMHNPNFFKKLLVKINEKNFDNFLNRISKLILNTKVKSYCKKKIKNFNNLKKIIPQMMNKKRFYNFIYSSKMNKKNITLILKYSFNEN